VKIIYPVLIFLVLNAILLFAGCDTVVDPSLNKIRESGKFIVGLDDTFAPMGFRDNEGNITGFDVEMAEEAANRLGVTVEFRPILWMDKEKHLMDGDIDMIWNGLMITDEGAEGMIFSNPYMIAAQVVMANSTSDIKTLKDLHDKRIGVRLGSCSMDALTKKAEDINITFNVVEYHDNFEAMLDLKTGRIDGLAVDQVLAEYYMGKSPASYKLLEENLGIGRYVVGFRAQDISLVREIQNILNEMKRDGTGDKISQKWFGQNMIR
jgi:polar amino acid transport system substrate-binding protein